MLRAVNPIHALFLLRACMGLLVAIVCLITSVPDSRAAPNEPATPAAEHTPLDLRTLDVRLFHLINLKPGRRDALDPFFLGIMPLGSRAAGAISLGLYGMGKMQNNSRLCDAGMLTGAAMVSSALISEAMKGAISRPRPLQRLGDSQVRVVGARSDDSRSFPSGHAATAFAWATVLADFYPEHAWVFFGTASAVGFGRVRLGAHYPSDVLAGALIGFLSGRLVVSYRELIQRGEGPAQGTTVVALSRALHF